MDADIKHQAGNNLEQDRGTHRETDGSDRQRRLELFDSVPEKPPHDDSRNSIAQGEEKRTAKSMEPVGDGFAADLDVRMAKSALCERGWRDRNDINDVMRDLERLASKDWTSAAGLWEKYRPHDIDKPVFIDGDDVPEKRSTKASTTREADAEQTQWSNEEPDRERSSFVPPAALLKRYLHADNRYYFRDPENKLAFHDKGKSVATDHDDASVVYAMVELAKAKSWHSIRVKGSEDFKREAWLQATLSGIEVEGFQARDVDIAKLNDRRSEAARQTDRGPQPASRMTSKAHFEVVNEPRQGLSDKQQTAVAAIGAVMRARGDSEKAIAMAVEIATERFQTHRIYVGKLMAHGAAPYENSPKNETSYYVKLQTSAGEQTIWGADLKRAIGESQAKRGDEIALAYQGRQPVTMVIKDKDDHGNIARIKEIVSHRNVWDIRQMEALRDEAKVRLVEAAKRVDRQPLIKVYDRDAPRRERGPDIGHESGRTAERARG